MVIFSINSIAQIHYEDGSYYNDDYIYKEPPKSKSPAALFDNTNPIVAPELPKPSKPIVRARKPKPRPGGFVEIRTGGQAGDFRDVGGSTSTQSFGTK